jgi:hypothetical protein
MSEAVTLTIPILGMAELLQTVAALSLIDTAAQSFETEDGGTHEVDLVVSDEGGTRVGVKIDEKTGEATFIAHDQRDRRGSALIGRIAQRHAYSRVMEELKRKGYQIASEEKQKDGSIKLVAQRWR